ncbi:DUF5710 domain-containing protein [Staphylococcus caledonicus]|uniref:DUF5710 domain-containing protein n=1 Tax=Staphylococcus caledonicus TaxID=2741333 RepID=UPI0018E4BCDA|nr:DUF5710 domain-containing protein [Staphylococcus caledonicus]MBI5973660.1 hypothetical protein [Staphylococcus caledonicus]
MLYLNVPYEEKDDAKSKFAKWDNKRKLWFATNPQYYFRFSKWVEGDSVVKNNIYIFIASKECWKCKQSTPVYAIGVKSEDIIDLNYPSNKNVYEETGYDVVFLELNRNIPSFIKEYLKDKTNCKERYSKTINKKYFANICKHCNALQGNNFIYDEIDSPFNSMPYDNYDVVEFELKNEIPLDYCIGERIISPSCKYLNANIHVKDRIYVDN